MALPQPNVGNQLHMDVCFVYQMKKMATHLINYNVWEICLYVQSVVKGEPRVMPKCMVQYDFMQKLIYFNFLSNVIDGMRASLDGFCG